MAEKNPKSTHEQTRRFEQAARELGCDEDPGRFDEALKKVARHKPTLHWSDCAVNNGPALPAGPCTCGGFKVDS